jgi:geranylgeranyl pyrophosphate synthase
LASPTQQEVLNKVGRPGISASDIADIQEVIQHTGALQTMEDRITQLTAESVGHLSGLSLGAEAIEQFKALAHLVSWRSL